VWLDGIRGGISGGDAEAVGPWAALAEIVRDVEEQSCRQTEDLDLKASQNFPFPLTGLYECSGEFGVLGGFCRGSAKVELVESTSRNRRAGACRRVRMCVALFGG
jgi:hypothetical protein